jgi:hypothetical protein
VAVRGRRDRLVRYRVAPLRPTLRTGAQGAITGALIAESGQSSMRNAEMKAS